MTAIVLAGGRGRRMKADKAGLAIGGQTLLEHVLDQVWPYFDEVIVGISPGQKLASLSRRGASGPLRQDSPSRASTRRVRIVEDETPGLGPIGGVLAGLRAARNESCAVVACDIPDIPIPLLRSLARAAGDQVIAVPAGPSGLYEPLLAVYKRAIVPEIDSLLAAGERSLLPLYERCRTSAVQIGPGIRLRNLNTRADYEAYLHSKPEGLRTAARRVGRRGRRSENGRRPRPRG